MISFTIPTVWIVLLLLAVVLVIWQLMINKLVKPWLKPKADVWAWKIASKGTCFEGKPVPIEDESELIRQGITPERFKNAEGHESFRSRVIRESQGEES